MLHRASALVLPDADRDPRRPHAREPTRTRSGWSASRCCCCRSFPASARTINGERLWVIVGPVSFQPSEVSKVLLTIFLASYLDRRKELLAVATRRIGPIRLPEPRYFGPLLLAWVVALAVLFVENDLGSSLLFFGIFVVMLWVATGRGTYLAAGILLFAAGGADRLPADPARAGPRDDLAARPPAAVRPRRRATSWRRASSGWPPAACSARAWAAGSRTTSRSRTRTRSSPRSARSSGLFGVTAILLLYVALCARGLRTALQRTDGFGKLLAVGLDHRRSRCRRSSSWAASSGVIPLTGITLPFVSYGGSSLITNFVLLALLVRVSAPRGAVPAPAPPRSPEPPRDGPADPPAGHRLPGDVRDPVRAGELHPGVRLEAPQEQPGEPAADPGRVPQPARRDPRPRRADGAGPQRRRRTTR